jgi:predicted DCC family thiol-disulfide oxidoreductase YuxK
VLVLYDDDCGICRLTVMALQRLDWRHRLDCVPLQDFTVAPGGPERADLLEALHVRDASGRWYRGGAAAPRIASVVPVLVPLAIVGRLPVMTWLVEWAYRFVANHRLAISTALDLERCALQLRADADRAG